MFTCDTCNNGTPHLHHPANDTRTNDYIKHLELQVSELKEDLEFARNYIGVEARPCPLCTYVEGKFISRCSMHGQLDESNRLNRDYKAALEGIATLAIELGDCPEGCPAGSMQRDAQRALGVKRAAPWTDEQKKALEKVADTIQTTDEKRNERCRNEENVGPTALGNPKCDCLCHVPAPASRCNCCTQ